MNPIKYIISARVFLVGLLIMTLGANKTAESLERAPLKILIIGATARTSEELIPQALEAGHEVIGLARRPDAIRFQHDNLTVFKGDVYDPESLKAVMTGSEVVISVYGPRTTPEIEIAESDLMSTGTSNIIAAMKEKGNKRLFATSSTSVQREIPKTRPVNVPLTQMWMWNMRGVYRDMRAMEDIVHASGLEAMVLRPCQLLQEPMRNDIKLAVDIPTPSRRLITYADFAAFILSQLESDKYIGSTVGLYSERIIDWCGNVDFEAEMEKLKRLKALSEAGT